MVAIKISNIRSFMNILLCQDAFDDFLLKEATIKNPVTFLMDGHTPEGITSFGQLRNICYEIIKGKRTPEYFKFVFLADDREKESVLGGENTEQSLPDIESFSLNIRYQNGELYATTGCALTIFSMDKTPEKLWDKRVCMFLEEKGIAYDIV